MTATSDTLTDDEWTSVQADLREHIRDFRDVYGPDGSRGQEIRYENDDVLILADGSGHELSEIADFNDVDTGALSRRMHAEARDRYDDGNPGDEWSVMDPVVIIKA
jgi:hypothetical protein